MSEIQKGADVPASKNMQNGLTGLKKAAIPVSKDVQKGLTDLKMQVSPDMETPLDKEIMRQFEDFSKKIIESTNARKDSEELLRKYRNLKLEKVSNNIYRISSFGYYTEFSAMLDSNNVAKCTINNGEIKATNIGEVLRLANLINNGLFFVQQGLNERPDYLNDVAGMREMNVFKTTTKDALDKTWIIVNNGHNEKTFRGLLVHGSKLFSEYSGRYFYKNPENMSRELLTSVTTYLNQRVIETFPAKPKMEKAV